MYCNMLLPGFVNVSNKLANFLQLHLSQLINLFNKSKYLVCSHIFPLKYALLLSQYETRQLVCFTLYITKVHTVHLY